MRQACLIALVGALGGVSAVSLAAPGDDFVGRWNLKIDGTGDSFSTSWLKIEALGAGYTGACVWKWGSVEPIQDVSVEGGTLRFKRGGERFEAKLSDGKLVGEATLGDGKKFAFSGGRATEICDVAGTWKMWPADNPDGGHAKLTLKDEGGSITGSATDPEGVVYELSDIKLDGRTLTLKSRPQGGDGASAAVKLEVRGDSISGKVEVSEPGSAETKTIELAGKRERQWGEPIALLAKDSLAGWTSRDENRKPGWKVVDGVLENSPPDVDIKSEAKFRDFRLHLEYNVEPGSNSGVYLRGRYELQVLGDTRIQGHGNMALYSRLKPQKNPIKLGEWNTLDVLFIGRWLSVVLNGETVYESQYVEGPTGGAYDEKEDEPGPLLLQGDHGKIRYRNIVVTPAK